MASSSSPSSLPDLHLHLHRLHQALTCSICLRLFKHAACLHCNHHFCISCLLQSMDNMAACPKCKLPATKRQARSSPEVDNLVNIYQSLESAASVHHYTPQVLELNDTREQYQNGSQRQNWLKTENSMLGVNDEVGYSSLSSLKKQKTQDSRGNFSSNERRVDSLDVEHPCRGILTASKRVQLPCPSVSGNNHSEHKCVVMLDTQSLNCHPASISGNSDITVAMDIENKDGHQAPTLTLLNNQGNGKLQTKEQVCLSNLEGTELKRCTQKKDVAPFMQHAGDALSRAREFVSFSVGKETLGSEPVQSEVPPLHSGLPSMRKDAMKNAKDQDTMHIEEDRQVSMKVSSSMRERLKDGALLNDICDGPEDIGVKSAKLQDSNRRADIECKQEAVQSLKSEHDGPGGFQASCAFCQTSNDFPVAGPMMHYNNEVPARGVKIRTGKLICVHKLCSEWAPNVYYVDDVAKNLPKEIARGQKIKCSSCGLKGAVLGCCVKRCRKSYHYPCARALSCRWDDDNFVMLCPEHVASRFPNEGEKEIMPIIANDHESEGNYVSAGITSPLRSMRAGYMIEKSSKKWPLGADVKWVLCGSGLNSKAKMHLASFVSCTGATFTKTWNSSITHLIVGTDEMGAARRTLKFLMATLQGRWILKAEWLAACMVAGHPVSEEPYEIKIDVHGMLEGPKHGRFMAISKAHELFEGLEFYFLGDYAASYKADLQSLIVAAGGELLSIKPGVTQKHSKKLTIIIYNKDSQADLKECDLEEIIKSRSLEAKSLASEVGAKAAGHTWILDSIAAYERQPFE